MTGNNKVQLTDFITLESSNGLITVDPEGIRKTVEALQKKRTELLEQVGFLMTQAQKAAEQAKELERLLGIEPEEQGSA